MEPLTDAGPAPAAAPARPRRRWLLLAAGLAAVVVLVAVVVAGTGRRGGGPPRLSIETAVVTEGEEVASAYLSVRNDGGRDDLVAVEAAGVGTATVHRNEERGGSIVMVEQPSLPVPGGRTTVLAPGGTHVMLEDLGRPLVAGQQVDLLLVFRRAGAVAVRASVVSYTQLAAWVERDDP